jgi:hypothetical protein
MTVTDPAPSSVMRPDVFAATLADQTLQALAVHRMLSTDQLHRLMSPTSTIDATRGRLKKLADQGLVDRFPVRNGRRGQIKVWHATVAGVDRAASDPDLTRRYVATRPKNPLRTLVAHTLAVNEVGLAFVDEARHHPGHECDYLAWEHEVAHSLGGDRRGAAGLIVDAVLSYTSPDPAGRGDRLGRRFVELDRGTMPTLDLFDKLRRYARYHDYRAVGGDRDPWWRQRYPTFPAICVVIGANPLKSDDQLTRRLHTVCDLAANDPLICAAGIVITACRFEQLRQHGPNAPIWWLPGHPDPVTWTGRPR